MRSRNRLFSFLLIFLLFCGTVPVVQAEVEPTAEDFTNASIATCNDPPISYSGVITSPDQVDYYAIDLVAGQVLTIDVDAEKIGSNLDSILEVFDSDGSSLGVSDDSNDVQEGSIAAISVDPYFEILVPLDSDVTYYIAISAASAVTSDVGDVDISNTGPYSLLLKCSDQSSSLEFTWPVDVGDLLGATGSNNGSLIKIIPENAPFPLGIGPIIDVEYDPSSILIFVAVESVGVVNTIDYIPARIVAIDPTSGNEVESYSLGAESVVALEAAENKLYGVRDDSAGVNYTLAEVTFDIDLETAILTDVVSLGPVFVRALAYNQSEKMMYGASGTDLVKIDLASSPPGEIGNVTLTGLYSEIVTLDFSHEDVLYGVDRSGNFFNVPFFSSGEAGLIGEPIVGVSSLTFVVGEAPQNEDPTINTICSSSFSNQTVASSESANNRFRKFKLKKTRRHSAIGLFKFDGELGEILDLSVCLEEKEVVESEEPSKSSWIEKLWPQWKPKNLVFVVIRDAIPEVDFREKIKAELTQDEPTLDITGVELPATGLYYIMVIRPFRHFHNFDYCLSLDSDGTAGDSLVVAWPNDESEENAPAASAEEKRAEPQADEGADNTSNEPTTPPSLQTTTASSPAAEKGGDLNTVK